MSTLTGKTALVTGGSRGIGRAIAERLGTEGARVAVHYGNDKDAAEDTVSAIENAGGDAFALRAELGIEGDAEDPWAAFDEHTGNAGLDILVNNAGTIVSAGIENTTAADFDRIFAINVKAPFFVIQQALPRLRDGGRIINLSSNVARGVFPDVLAYAMTKSAIETLTRSVALDLGPRGITVNAVAPGITDTAMNSWLAVPEARAFAAAQSPLGRVGQPTDIADAVAFLVSSNADWITGHILEAGGGIHLGPTPPTA